MATIVKHAIRTTEGWNSMSSAEQAQYAGYYTTLSAWKTARFAANPNLVTADVVEVAECFNDWPNGLNDSVVLSGWIVDATRYPIIKAATGHRHTGKRSSGFYMYTNDGGSAAISIPIKNAIIEGIEARNTYYNSADPWNGFGIQVSAAISEVLIDSCIIETIDDGFGAAALVFNTGDHSGSTVRKCILHGSHWTNTPKALQINGTGSGPKIQNCILNGSYVTNSAPTTQLVNTILMNGSFSTLAIYDALSSNNAAYNGASVTPPGSNPLKENLTYLDFVDLNGQNYIGGTPVYDRRFSDFRSSQYSKLHRKGINLYSLFTTDIDGTVLPETDFWDIGIAYKQASTKKAEVRRSWMMGTGTKPPTQKNELSINKEYIQTPRETPTVNRQYVKNIKDIVLLATVNYARTNLANNLAGVIFSSTVFIPTLDLTGVSLQEDGLSFRNTNPTTGVGVISTNPVYDLDRENEFLVITTFKFTGFGSSWPPGICSLSDRASISFNTTTSLSIQANSRSYIHSELPNLFDSKEHTLVILVRREPDFNTRYIFIDGIEYGYIKQADTATYAPTSMNYFFNTSTYANRYPASGSIYKLFACLRSKDILMPEVAKELSAKPWKLFSTTTKNLITTKPKNEDIYPVTRTVSSPAPSLILPKKTMQQPQGPVEVDQTNPLVSKYFGKDACAWSPLGNYTNLIPNLTKAGSKYDLIKYIEAGTVEGALLRQGPKGVGLGLQFTGDVYNSAGWVSKSARTARQIFNKTLHYYGDSTIDRGTNAVIVFNSGNSYGNVMWTTTSTIVVSIANRVLTFTYTLPKEVFFSVVCWSDTTTSYAKLFVNGKFVEQLSGVKDIQNQGGLLYPLAQEPNSWQNNYAKGPAYFIYEGPDEVWSDADVISLHQNPWQVFKPIKRRIITGV